MSQKKCWTDRTTQAMRRLVAATGVDQWHCPTFAPKSGVGDTWIRRYRQGGPTWFLERSRRPQQMARCVSATFEQTVIRTHARLTSPRDPLGFYGAEAIARELADLGVRPVHSIRTIHRILVRHKLVTRTRRDRSRRGPSLPTPPTRRQHDVHQPLGMLNPGHKEC